MSSKRRYDLFWESLSPAYPITQGRFKIPIATAPIELAQGVHSRLIHELTIILDDMLRIHGNRNAAVLRAAAAGEERIIPLITDEYTGIVRFDCVVDKKTGEFKVLEVNCDYPDGLILHDKTYSALTGKNTTLHQDLLADIIQPAGEISILYSPEATFLDSYHAEKRALEECLATFIHIGDNPVYPSTRTIRRCLEVSKMSEDDCRSLAKHPHTYLNTFALRTLGYKNLLSSLAHPYIPKTLEVTLENYLLFTNDKNIYVVKPMEGCEGNGIYFGKDFPPEAWESLLKKIASQHYVAQEFIELLTRKVELYRDGTVDEQEFFFDLCPYFFIKQGRIIGNGHTLVRLSTEPIVNVSKGGGIGYHTLT